MTVRAAAAILIVLLVLAVRAQQPVPGADAQSVGATVRGTVVNAVTGEPIPLVSVSISMRGASPAITDALGRFAFERVPGGRYRVYSSITAGYDHLVGDGSALITVAPDAKRARSVTVKQGTTVRVPLTLIDTSTLGTQRRAAVAAPLQ